MTCDFQFATTTAGASFWRGTRALLVCVDGNIADVSGAVLRWLESNVVEECKLFEPKAVIFVLITKADLMQPEKIQNVAKMMDDYISSGFCTTWALVSAKKMMGQTKQDKSLTFLSVV